MSGWMLGKKGEQKGREEEKEPEKEKAVATLSECQREGEVRESKHRCFVDGRWGKNLLGNGIGNCGQASLVKRE